MAASNRQIALDYIDGDVVEGVGYQLKRLKKALKQTAPTELEFNTFLLSIDPKAQTATLYHDWFACKPEVFDAPDLIELIETARKRHRSN